MIIGVNYWPINIGMNFWKHFDSVVIEEDFSRIKETNLKIVRIFLLWEDFQPLPKKISIKMIDNLIDTLEIANEKGLKVLPTLFTGHMSGFNYLPPWLLDFGEKDSRFPIISEGKRRNNPIKNFYNDKELIEAQKFFIREISNALRGHPSLWAWDLGNEASNIVIPLTKEQGIVWLEEIVSEIKKSDETNPVTFGLHQTDLEEDRNIGPKEVSQFCDFLSIHTYPIYAKWAENLMDEDIVPFLALITRWLGSKDVLVEEVGIPSSDTFKNDIIVKEEDAYKFYERLFKKLKSYPFIGTLIWCYCDYSKNLWDEPPFAENIHGRFFGIFREDKSPKPFANIIKSFGSDGKENISTEWINIEPSDYYKEPLNHIKRLYQKFKEWQG